MVIKDAIINYDMNYEAYDKRQRGEVTPERIDACAKTLKPSEHFVFNDNAWSVNEYQGYAVVSMVGNLPENLALAAELQHIQDEMLEQCGAGAFYMLPRASFHQTVANTLSAIRFKKIIQEPGLEDDYPNLIEGAFKRVNLPDHNGVLKMKLVGLSIFGTAIGMLGVFENEADYNQITSFRSQFYSDMQLASLDVRMTRPFIGHITLAYLGREVNQEEKQRIAYTVNQINERIERDPMYFYIDRTELRRYDHLADFQTSAHYPVFKF